MEKDFHQYSDSKSFKQEEEVLLTKGSAKFQNKSFDQFGVFNDYFEFFWLVNVHLA